MLPSDYLSLETQLEIDDYDKVSVPLGGFVLRDKEELAILARIITLNPKEDYINKTKKIISDQGDDILECAFTKEIEYPFSVLRDCDKNGEVTKFLKDFGGFSNAVEYSRIMGTDEKFRGLYLSTKMVQFHSMYSKYILGAKIGFATCLVKHVEHNCNRNGFSGTIPGVGIIDAKRVEQVASAIYVDLNNIQNDDPEYHNSTIDESYKMFKKYGYFCYCKRKDCILQGYKLDKSIECERRIIGYE